MKLKEFIEKEISYDANTKFECPRCGYHEKDYWIDHKDSLASQIAKGLNLRSHDEIAGIMSMIPVTGNKSEDAELITQMIDTEICGTECFKSPLS